MQKNMAQKLATVGILVALDIVLSRFLSINTFNMRIGFGFVPVVLAAVLYGPVWAALTAGLADVLGVMLFPTGPYFPGFTLTAILMGLTYGLLLYKQINLGRIVAAVTICRIPLSLGLNTLWISVLYGKAFMALVPARIFQEAVLFPIHILVIWFVAQKMPLLLRRRAQ